ncbi:MAG: integration host factor subunit beta [Candidatus Marinimicrobia bacterium]|nr:integration host factor subunit beta [Candidatus Neomarinimicrobiota bacterium]
MEKKTFTKKDIAKHIRKNSSSKMRIYECEKYMDEIFSTMLELLMDESAERIRIEIRNFGVFEVKNSKAKPQARNPKTNEVIYVPARKKIHFKAGKTLKEFLSAPREEND